MFLFHDSRAQNSTLVTTTTARRRLLACAFRKNPHTQLDRQAVAHITGSLLYSPSRCWRFFGCLSPLLSLSFFLLPSPSALPLFCSPCSFLLFFSFTLLCLFWFCFWSSLKRGRVHEKNKTKYYLVRVLSCWIFVGACVKAIYRLEDGLNWNESFGRRRKPNDSRRPTISLFLFPLISFEMKSNEEKNAHLFRSLFCMQKDACRLYCVIVFFVFFISRWATRNAFIKFHVGENTSSFSLAPPPLPWKCKPKKKKYL